MVTEVLQADMRDIQAIDDMLSTLNASCHMLLTTSPHGYEVAATLVAVVNSTEQMLEITRHNEECLIANAGHLLGILNLTDDS